MERWEIVKQFCNIRGTVLDDAIKINIEAVIEDLQILGINERFAEDDDYNAYCALVASYVKPKVIDNYTLAQNVIDDRTRKTNRFKVRDANARSNND